MGRKMKVETPLRMIGHSFEIVVSSGWDFASYFLLFDGNFISVDCSLFGNRAMICKYVCSRRNVQFWEVLAFEEGLSKEEMMGRWRSELPF